MRYCILIALILLVLPQTADAYVPPHSSDPPAFESETAAAVAIGVGFVNLARMTDSRWTPLMGAAGLGTGLWLAIGDGGNLSPMIGTVCSFLALPHLFALWTDKERGVEEAGASLQLIPLGGAVPDGVALGVNLRW